MKKEFDFSREFGEIDVKLVENAGKEWERKKIYVFQLYGRKIAGIAILVMFCIIVTGNAKVQAAVREFTTKIGQVLGFSKDLSSYTEIINQTQTKNGISLTLKEVIVDDRILIVSVNVDASEDWETVSLWVNEGKTKINGQKYMTYESIRSLGGDGDWPESEEDRILVQVYEKQILPEGEVNVHLVLEAGKTNLPPFINKSLEGEAEFVYDFVITPEELKSKTVKQELDVMIGTEEKSLTLKELTMNDLYCRMIAEGVTWDDDWPNQYDIKLKGKDSFGNPVSLEGGRFISKNEMIFSTDFLGDYEAGETVGEDEFQMSVPDKDCDYLDLQIYDRKIIWEESTEVLEENKGYGLQESDEVQKIYSEEENYGWEPVGKPFRILVTH